MQLNKFNSATNGIVLNIPQIAEKPEWKQILVDVVQKEQLDPWDIDIALLALKYATEIKRIKELNLRVPANVILASSILLRYKSDSWILMQQQSADELIYIPNEVLSEPVIPHLEPVLRHTQRKVTLKELIAAVEDIIGKEKKKALKSKSIKHYIPEPLLEMIELTGEDFEKHLAEVYDELKSKVDKENLALFSQLLKKKNVEHVVGYFVPLLHLANKQKIAMWQEKVFGEIFILLLDGTDKNANKRNRKKSRRSKPASTSKRTRAKKAS